MLSFNAIRSRQATLEDLCANLDIADLHRLTDEMIDAQLLLVAGALDEDVTFQPVDPDAHDEYATDVTEANLAWTLAHVIVHTTASSEECAAHSSMLARGVPTNGRCRYEVPWQSLTTVAQLRQRLEESRRMRHAFLNSWPERPDLQNTWAADAPNAKPRNAIQRFVSGLAHDDAHLGQIAEIMRQARQARDAG